MLTNEILDGIFENTETNYKFDGDRALQGLNIFSKYVKTVVLGAEHDVLYGPDVDTIIEAGLTEEDAISLALLGWNIDGEQDCFYTFV